MDLRFLRGSIWIVVGALSAWVPAQGRVVYTWVDAGGVTHFSDEPPLEHDDRVQSVELPPSPAPPPGLDPDYYSIANQAKRLEQSRLEIERARTARLQAEAAQARAASTDNRQYRDSEGNTYYGGYYYGGRSSYPSHPIHPGHHTGRYRAPPNPGGYNAINGYAPLQSRRRTHHSRGSRYQAGARRR